MIWVIFSGILGGCFFDTIDPFSFVWVRVWVNCNLWPQIRSVAHVNKAYLVWLMFRVLCISTLLALHQSEAAFLGERSFSKSWGLRASGSFFPLPLPRHSFYFCSRPNFSRGTRAETLATQATPITKVNIKIWKHLPLQE